MWFWDWKLTDFKNDSGFCSEKNGIHANTEPHDVTSVTDQGVDLLLVSNELYPQVKDKVSCPILIIENFVDEAEVEEKLLPKVKELAGE